MTARYRVGVEFPITTSLGRYTRHAGKRARIVSDATARSHGLADVLSLTGRVVDTLAFVGQDLPA